MKMYLKFGGLVLLWSTLVLGVTSCSDDDPDYSDVTPPTVAQVHNISGSIAGMDGKGIQGATVTMSGAADATTQTDANGYFVFENVSVGTYNLKATATGKLSKDVSVSVTEDGKGKNVVWNVMLASEESLTSINVDMLSGGEGNVTTEALKDNEKAEIPVEVSVASNSLNKNATIEVSPIYSEEEAKDTRSSENTLMVGAKLSCSDNTVSIENDIELTFSVDEVTTTEVKAKKYSGGNWVDVPTRIEGDKVVVLADEFTSYGLFVPVVFTISDRVENIKFEQSVWDNLYGSGDMFVGSATYTYKVGIDVETAGTSVFTALLVEVLARHFGANSYETQGHYPLNVTLPIGTYLQISGVQHINTVTASVGSRSVKGTQYGDVEITVKTSNRQHTGGGSKG